jgi:hypothetical protein
MLCSQYLPSYPGAHSHLNVASQGAHAPPCAQVTSSQAWLSAPAAPAFSWSDDFPAVPPIAPRSLSAPASPSLGSLVEPPRSAAVLLPALPPVASPPVAVLLPPIAPPVPPVVAPAVPLPPVAPALPPAGGGTSTFPRSSAPNTRRPSPRPRQARAPTQIFPQQRGGVVLSKACVSPRDSQRLTQAVTWAGGEQIGDDFAHGGIIGHAQDWLRISR